MFKPPAATASVMEVLEAPFPITIEFTDYASYQHHQFRRQQYQQQLKLQEQYQREEEHYRQYQAQLQIHIQNQLQSQLASQQAYQQQFTAQQSQTFAAPFQQSFPSTLQPELPFERPAGQGQIHLERQELPGHRFLLADANMQDYANHGPAPSAHAANIDGFLLTYSSKSEMGGHHSPILGLEGGQTGYLVHYQNKQNALQAGGQGQLLPAASPFDPLAQTPSAALATGTFPANSSPVCNNTDFQLFGSASPTYFAASPHNSAPASSAVSSSPNTTASPTSPTPAGNNLRQIQHPHRHPHQQRQHLYQNQHNVNHNSLNEHQAFQHAQCYNYHQHLHQQIQERRLKKAHTIPVVHPGVYAFSNPPPYSSVTSLADSLPSQLLEQQRQQQQHELQQHAQTHDHEQLQYLYPAFPLAAMAVGYQQVVPNNEEEVLAEIAAQQAAAQGYQPDANGPGIDRLHITEDLQAVYANADASFVEKTAKLPRAFPLYRPVSGDGNCGWRAIGFCYFELLVHSKSADLIASERKRLLDLNDYIRNVGGYDPYVYEDMVEETDMLFGKILELYPNYESAMEAVLDAFNDMGAANAIIYHLRLLAASYLKGNVDKYDGFFASENGIAGYCHEWIERPNCEIDHLRIELLANILIESTDMVLEIVYLDRSQNSHLPTYRFPESNVGRADNTIDMRMSLLFRPDHYDILYRPSCPSPEMAEAVLSQFHTPEGVTTALTPDAEQTATIIAGEPVSSEPEAAVQPVPSEPEAVMQPQAMESIPLQQPVAIYEGTPGLTPGSSINSPALIHAKVEPLTPLALSGASVQAIPQSALAVAAAEAAEASDMTGTGSAAACADTLPPTDATPGFSSSDSRSPDASRVPSSGGSEPDGASGQSAGIKEEPAPPVAASSSAGVSSSNDCKIYFVGDITYGNMQPSESGQASLGAGSDLLSQLPFLFGTAPPDRNSALFGTGNWSSSSLRSRFSDTFCEPPMTAQTQPKAVASSVQAAPATIASVPTSDLMPPPPPPQPAAVKTGEPSQEIQAGNSSAAEGQLEPVVRFTQWHYKRNETVHDAMDRESTSFRSKIGAAAHFCSSKFQPNVYNPGGSSKNGGVQPAQPDEDDEDPVPASQLQ